MDQPIINDRLGDFITSLSQLSDPGDASFDGERIKGIRERAAAILNGPDAPVIDALLAPPTPGTRLPEGACPHGSYRHVCQECLAVTVAAPMVEQGGPTPNGFHVWWDKKIGSLPKYVDFMGSFGDSALANALYDYALEAWEASRSVPVSEQGDTPECDAVAEFIHDKGMTEWVPAYRARSLERRLRSKATAADGDV